jgi:hypothetical protein
LAVAFEHAETEGSEIPESASTRHSSILSSESECNASVGDNKPWPEANEVNDAKEPLPASPPADCDFDKRL